MEGERQRPAGRTVLPLSWSRAALGVVPTCSCPHPPLLHMPLPSQPPLPLLCIHAQSPRNPNRERLEARAELAVQIEKCQFEGAPEHSGEGSLLAFWVR